MSRCARQILLLGMILVLTTPAAVEAQWVFVARKGLQIVRSIAGPEPGAHQGQGADAATVILEANAAKVYAVAVQLLRENPDFRILWQDDARRAIAFSKGGQSASMKVSGLDEHLTQILVASTYGPPGGTTFVVEGILRVCKHMGVECTHAAD